MPSDQEGSAMQYAVHYRLRSADLDSERSRLVVMYADLAAARPSWLSCASFMLDELGSMLLLISTDAVERLSDLPSLSNYLTGLGARREGDPRAGVLDRAALDTTSLTELGSWEPAGTPGPS